MNEGILSTRGSEAVAMATGHATEVMARTGAPTALCDISRRPKADIIGAAQHPMAALECGAREADGNNDTLSQIIKWLGPGYQRTLHKLWVGASEHGRHMQPGVRSGKTRCHGSNHRQRLFALSSRRDRLLKIRQQF